MKVIEIIGYIVDFILKIFWGLLGILFQEVYWFLVIFRWLSLLLLYVRLCKAKQYLERRFCDCWDVNFAYRAFKFERVFNIVLIFFSNLFWDVLLFLFWYVLVGSEFRILCMFWSFNKSVIYHGNLLSSFLQQHLFFLVVVIVYGKLFRVS